MDFDKKWPDKELILEKNWKKLFEDVYSLRKDHIPAGVGTNFSRIYEETRESRGADGLRILLLPYLTVSGSKVKCSRNKAIKFSVTEASEGFVIYCKVFFAILGQLVIVKNTIKRIFSLDK